MNPKSKKKFKKHFSNEPRKKKYLGQHFLRKQSVVDHMIDKVKIDSQTSVMEIGCGDGFLTSAILEQTKAKQLWCYEIDPEWANYVSDKIKDPRLRIRLKNILETNFDELKPYSPWVLLANLPYQITFPILFLLFKNKALFSEGVVMVQEEVAQKIVAKTGRSYSATSLFLQYHFDFEMLEKIEPGAFSPPPKVYSRLVYFKPKFDITPIPDEDDFWKFLKLAFKSPRRTLRNNLKTTHYELPMFSNELLEKRAQQVSFEEFLEIWKSILAR